MPRIARVVALDYPHHVTQRGNYRQEIFVDDTDREKYLSLLKTESKRYGLKVLSYCLMSNHVHFIVVPECEDSMGNVFKYVNMKYSQYYNNKMGVCGHLFQGRFYSCVMDEVYSMVCARYIERNPVRARIVKDPWDWKWSSARVHCELEEEDSMGVNQLFQYVGLNQGEWRNSIAEPDSVKDITRIQEQTRKGRPLAEISFVQKLEKKLNRPLILKPRGRPKEKENK
ncbi:MAG: transposase [Candidatus Aureabacteria bacterium]|nr:transposase [Candidatus Auribacterota bacterium]MCK5161987.1 transposase [Candidatus Auribacterota bacterium]